MKNSLGIVLISLLLMMGCIDDNPMEVPENVPGSEVVSKAATPGGVIINYKMPAYKTYFGNAYNKNLREIKASATVLNISGIVQRFDVKLIIVDPVETPHVIAVDSIDLLAGKSTPVNLEGDLGKYLENDLGEYNKGFVSGWFTAKIEVKPRTQGGAHSVAKPKAFSAFKRAENYADAISEYSNNHWLMYDYTDDGVWACGTDTTRNPFGYNSLNVKRGGGNMNLEIPKEKYKGGGTTLKDEFKYGEFRANIKMDLKHPYSLGAFWLRNVGDHFEDSIVMEMFYGDSQNPEGPQPYFSCIVHKDGKHTFKKKASTSHLIPRDVFEIANYDSVKGQIHYRITWTDKKVQFLIDYGTGSILLFDTERDGESDFTPAMIPHNPMRLCFQYRMTPWTGHYKRPGWGHVQYYQCLEQGNAPPPPPSSRLNYTVSFASW